MSERVGWESAVGERGAVGMGDIRRRSARARHHQTLTSDIPRGARWQTSPLVQEVPPGGQRGHWLQTARLSGCVGQ